MPSGRPFHVGVYLPQNVPADTLFAWARVAEAAGLGSLWLPEHLHQFPDPRAGRLEAWTVLGALAAQTSGVRLGLGVCNVRLRNPTLLAKMAFTLDRLTYGRFDLALGTGGNATELRAYGYPPMTRAEARGRLRDAILTIRALESGGPASAPPDCALPFRDAYCHPTPRRRPFPLAVAADHPDTMRLAVEHAARWYANLYTVDRFAEQNARLTALAEEMGRDPATLRRTAHVLVILERTDAEARLAAERYAAGPRARLFEEPHLVGNGETVARGLRAYREAGADAASVYLLNLPTADVDRGKRALRLLARTAVAVD